MIGATAKADQFATRSGNESTKGSRKGFSLLGGGENAASVLNEREARESRQAALRGQLKTAQAEHALAKKAMIQHFGAGDAFFKWRAEKDRAGKAILDICAELSLIKKEYTTGRPRSLENCFMDACRESMTVAHFKIMLDEAHRRARAAEIEAEGA